MDEYTLTDDDLNKWSERQDENAWKLTVISALKGVKLAMASDARIEKVTIWRKDRETGNCKVSVTYVYHGDRVAITSVAPNHIEAVARSRVSYDGHIQRRAAKQAAKLKAQEPAQGGELPF